MKYNLFSRLISLGLSIAFAVSFLPTAIFAEGEAEVTAPVVTAETLAVLDAAEPTAEPVPTAEPTPVPTAAPAPTPVPTAMATATAIATATATAAATEVAMATAAASAAPALTAAAEMAEYTAETEDGIRVTASVDKNAFDKEVVLVAEYVADDAADAQAAAADAEEDMVGKLVLDVHFEEVGTASVEVEPKEGYEVNVRFEFPAAMLPEEADQSTLSVQHLVEDEAGNVTETKTVADAGNETAGTIAVQDDTIVAEFAVDSFSYFEITYSGRWNDYTLTVYCVDTAGNPILGQSNVKLDADKDLPDDTDWQNLLDDRYVPGIEGYTYEYARTENQDELTHIKFREKMFGGGWRYANTTGTPNGNGTGIPSNEIYLVYQKKAVTPTPTTSTKPLSVSANKTAKDDDGDGIYDLALDVSSQMGSETQPTKVDVVFVLDTSGSMKYNMNNSDGSGGARRKAANDAINTLVTSLNDNISIDAQYALVTFAENAQLKNSWTKGTLSLPTSSNGGTNYEAGLAKATELLASARTDAVKVVIFISDGKPTYSVTYGGNGSTYRMAHMVAAQKQIEKMTNVNYFFPVGVGPSSQYDNLNDLVTAGSYTFQNNEGGSDNNNRSYNETRTYTIPAGMSTASVVAGTDETKLKNAFSQIAATITQIQAKDVTISDTLSQYVDIVPEQTGVNSGKIAITVTAEKAGETPRSATVYCNGTETASASLSGVCESITVHYDADIKKITVSFGKDYELEDGWTYTVTTKIKPNSTAYETFKNNGYTKQGEENTGTHSGQPGFASNGDATVTYTQTGKDTPETKYYPKPVVQVQTGNVTIEKTIDGLETISDDIKHDLTFTLYSAAAENVSGADVTEKFTLDDEDVEETAPYTYTYTFYNLPVGTYTVTESGAAVGGYDLVVADSNNSPVTEGTGDNAGTYAQTAQVEKNIPKTLGFTNTYTPQTGTLTIQKIVNGKVYDDGRDMFTFKLAAPDGVVYYYSVYGVGVALNAETLPAGTYTVTEMENAAYTLEGISISEDTAKDSTTSASTATVKLNGGETATVTFTNVPKGDPYRDGGGAVNIWKKSDNGGYVITQKKNKGDTVQDDEPSND